MFKSLSGNDNYVNACSLSGPYKVFITGRIQPRAENSKGNLFYGETFVD
jgi:hypothetical protein